jgi:hypothetical protein
VNDGPYDSLENGRLTESGEDGGEPTGWIKVVGSIEGKSNVDVIDILVFCDSSEMRMLSGLLAASSQSLRRSA